MKKKQTDISQTGSCCSDMNTSKQNPDHSKELHRINRISGQLEGVKRMILANEYCPKIITQIQAVRAALKSLESAVLSKHLEMCVQEAFNSRDKKDADLKIAELLNLFKQT